MSTASNPEPLPPAEPSAPQATEPTDWVMLQVQMPLEQMRAFAKFEHGLGEPVTAQEAEYWKDAIDQIWKAAATAVEKADSDGGAK